MKPVEIEFIMKDKLSEGIASASNNIKGMEDASKSAEASVDQIKAHLTQLGKTCESLETAIAGLQGQYEVLGRRASEAFMAGRDAEARALQASREAIQEEIQVRQEELEVARTLSSALDNEVAKREGTATATEEQTATYKRMSAELRGLEAELARMSLDGKRNTEEYQAMSKYAGELADTIGDVKQQVRHLADDNAHLTAFADGLNGLAGGFAAATGVVSLFAGENEKLAEVQTRLQSVIAITMGMQQVYNTLNKDSAFQTILVAKAKDFLTAANARLATALGISTAAATALMAALTLGLSVAIAAVIIAYNKFSSAQEEAAEKAKELREIERSGREESIKARYEIDNHIATLKEFNGTKEEEKAKVKELNGLYGDALGYYDSVAQWYDVLRAKSEAYTKVLFLQAKMQELANRTAKADLEVDEAKNTNYSLDWFSKGMTHLFMRNASETIARQEAQMKERAVKTAEQKRDSLHQQMQATFSELNDLRKTFDIGGHEASKSKGSKGGKKNGAEDRAKQIKSDAKALADALTKAQQELEDQQLDLLEKTHQKIEDEAQRMYDETIARITEEAANKRGLYLRLKSAGADLSPTQLADIDEEERMLKAKAKRIYEDGLLSAMREGFAKQQQEAKIQHQRTLEQIEKDTKEQKELYDRLKKNGAKVTPEQLKSINDLDKQRKAQADALYKATTDRLSREENKQLSETQRQQQDALNTMLAKYQDYATQRASITKQYGEDEAELLAKRTDANAAVIDAAIAQLRKSRTEALKQVDTAQIEDLKNSSELFKNLFSGMADKTRREVQEVIAQIEQLSQYLHSKDITPTQRANMAKALGITPEALEAIERTPDQIKAIDDSVKKLKGNTSTSPFQKFTASLDEAIKKLSSGDIVAGLTAINGAVKEFAPYVKQFGEGLGTIFGDSDLGDKIGRITEATEGLGQTAQGVGQIMSGDIVGGTMAVVEGVKKIVDALDGLFGANYDKYNAAKQQYEDYMDVLDGVIDRQRKMVETLDAANALKSYDYAKKLVEGSAETARQLGRERLNAGASAGSHSIGVRQRKKMMNDQAWAEARAALGSAFDAYHIGEGRMTGLFDLSIAQMEKLRDEAPMFWAKLDGDVRKYMEDIIKSGEGVDDLKKALTENLTATSFDSLYDSFQSTLEDMSKGASDFASDFQKLMQKAMFSTVMKEQVEARLKAWHEQFANANKDGRIADDEVLALRRQWDSIVQDAIGQRNALMESMGMANTTAQQATRGNSFSTLTQTQGTKLEGLFTAGQIHWSSMDYTTQAIAKDTAHVVGTLASIKEDTLYLRHLKTLDQRMERIERDGLKVK